MSKPFGTWDSPITGKSIASGISLQDVQWNNAGNTLVWWERRAKVGVLVAQTGFDAPRDLTDESLNVSGRVGYGGGAFTANGGQVYFSANDRLYKQALAGGTTQVITPKFGSYASPAVSYDGNWLVAVHSYDDTDGIVLLDTNGEQFPRKLAYGTDFVMQPTWHPAGTHIAYVVWNHPQMPWNGTELRLMQLATDGSGIPYAEHIITLEGDPTTAIFQPQFSPDGRYLSYISDATGWGQVYIYDLEEQTHIQLTDTEAEHGTPAWIQGMRTYDWTPDSQHIYYLENSQAFIKLMRYNVLTAISELVSGLDHYTDMTQITVSPDGQSVTVIGSSSTIPSRIVSLHQQQGEVVHRRRQTENLQANQLSSGEAIIWQGEDGQDVHGLYYAPVMQDEMPDGVPPLLVYVHGGPTSQRTAGYYGEVQFFTTRGYAVLQVNHRGSTGYGKAYMDMHKGNWGVYDVIDSVSGVNYLVDNGLVDGEKVIIMGGSAGGFTVLQSLIDYPQFYKAGVCSYGVSNQFGLAMDTHKFEARYTDWLLGALPESADTYRERSPIFHAQKIEDPMIVFQGTDDPVVPQNQSDDIVASLRRRGIPHEYHLFEGEGHGWRKPETIETFYNKIERFLLQHVIYA
jgi:dipeptidyl aminopeptidase/acylaminoacyl peptidase